VDVSVASTAAPPAPCARRDGDGCLKLGDGMMLFFSKASIPDPPAVSFAKNIPRLVRLWDDVSTDWDPSDAVLRIQGRPIALKYWPELYRYGKTGQWAGTKKNWAHWRVSDPTHLRIAQVADIVLPLFCRMWYSVGATSLKRDSGPSSVPMAIECHSQQS
jgi:hypothetical protein